MSYNYYADELNRLPLDDGYGISIQVRSGGEHTKWMTLTPECKNALREFMNGDGFVKARPDPDGPQPVTLIKSSSERSTTL